MNVLHDCRKYMNRNPPTADTKRRVPPLFSVENYTFDLPEKQIAQYPTAKRSDSRLLVLDRPRDSLHHARFHDLLCHLPEGAVLVVNTSRVSPARLRGSKSASGGKVEFLLLTPLPVIRGLDRPEGGQEAVVEGLIRPAKKIQPGRRVRFADDFGLDIRTKDAFGRIQGTLFWKGRLQEKLERYGEVPLPPYLKRNCETADTERYQTVYANADRPGSVAAPTAGLHFDDKLLDKLGRKRIEIIPLNLFVGYGTFSPIRCTDIREHELHPEYVEIPQDSAQKIVQAKNQGRPVVAVGTTTVRSLEGVREQCGELRPYAGWLHCYIYPGYTFEIVDHLLTNFHLPQSSLLLMIAAFAGRERVLEAYQLAVDQGYRFYSYGDAMLIL